MADPVITSLSPNTGPIGQTFRIVGRNFFVASSPDEPPTVTLGSVGVPVLSFDGSNIIAQVPTGASTGLVVVFAQGVSSNGVLFTVSPASGIPHITSILPTSGPTGTIVTITGTNFGSAQNTSTVTFNGIVATVSSWSSTSIVASVPGTATTGNVVVTAAGVASNVILFTVTTPSNGGTQQPLNLLLIPGLNFLTATIWTLDPTNFDDPVVGGFYFFKMEDVIAGRTPTINRAIISYRNLGVATFTLAITATDDSGAVVNTTVPVTVGTAAASGRITTKVVGVSLTGQNLQVSVSRVPGSGPLSITKIRLEGKVETTTY